MEIAPQRVLKYKHTLAVVDGLIEQWFNENGVPLEYRMSTPLILLYERRKDGNFIFVNYSISILSNLHEQGGGYC